jgi:hypothetical protein
LTFPIAERKALWWTFCPLLAMLRNNPTFVGPEHFLHLMLYDDLVMEWLTGEARLSASLRPACLAL